jgi:NADPH-dependent curcumin reductase CurA
MSEMNQEILLVSRPTGAASGDNFKLVAVPLVPLKGGEFRVRGHYLSLDPYMRGRMNDAKSYAAPQPLNQLMQGGVVGEVTESLHDGFKVGDKVVGGFGWCLFAVSDGTGVRKVEDGRVPLSAYLGAVGMPGVTGWYGLNRICAPKAGETVVVSAASGAVGGVVGQLAKRGGCRVVGVAGGADKCRYVVDELGFDACIDYKGGALDADLRAAAPQGIDAYFDNVGGPVLDAVIDQMNAFGRIAMCGAIAGYDGVPIPLAKPSLILRSRLKVQGFIVSEHLEDWPQALQELGGLVANGALKYRETIAQGLASAPEALLGLLKGRNFGKQLVKLI